MASQAGSYGALIAGGVLVVAGFTGHSIRDVLAGKSSPLKGLISDPPAPTGGTNANVALRQGSNAGSAAALSGNGYVKPFGSGWVEGRTDQGVDFAPQVNGAPILSPGAAKVLKIGAPGWPSGEKGVLLQLLNGPLKGKIIFIYEAINPTVRVGELVAAGQVIGHGVLGETGVEIGFSDSAGVPLAHGEYTEGKVTKWGTAMRNFLAGLSTTAKRKNQSSGGTQAKKTIA